MQTEKKCFKPARAGRQSQKLALPAESYGTLSKQQADGIVKDAARRLNNKTLTAEAELAGLNKIGSAQLSDHQMNVERLGVAREMLSPRNCNARQQGTLGSRVDQFCTVREQVTRSHELDCDLEVLSKADDSLRDAATTASTWSQPSGLNPEGKYVPQVSVITCTPVTGNSELIDRSQVRITSAKLLQRERQLNEKTVKS